MSTRFGAFATRAGSPRLPTLSRLPDFRRNLWLLLVACLLVFTAIGVQALILNLYLLSIGFREDYLGLFSLANTVGIGAAALLAGRVVNRFGCRRILIGASLLQGLSSAGLVLFPDPVIILAIAVVNGVSLAHIFVPIATFIMDNASPNERAAAFSGYFTSQSIAMVIGSLIGGILPSVIVPGSEATPTSYALTLVIAGLAAALAVIPLALADDSVAEGSQSFNAAPGSAVDQRRQVRRDILALTIASGITAMAMGFVIPFLNVFFSVQLGVNSTDIGLIFAIGSVAMAIASALGPVVGARVGTVMTIVLFRALTGPMILALGFTGSVGLASALYVARTLFTNLTWPVDNAFTMELVPPRQRSTLSGLRSASWNFAWAAASGLGGLMIVQLGFSSIFIAGAAFMVAGSLVFYYAFRSRAASSGLPKPLSTSRPAVET